MQLKLYGTLQVFLFVYAARNTGAVLTFNINSLAPVFSKHFVKFLRTPILWSSSILPDRCQYGEKFACFQFIGSSFDLIISKLQTKEMLLICLQIQDKIILNYYSLSSHCCIKSDNNTSVCTVFCAQHLLKFELKTRKE